MTQREPPMGVAIVGIGCRFPGGVMDPAGFWRYLLDGGDAITRIPADRFDLAHFYDATPATPGRVMTQWGGFLDGLREFDAAFFRMSPREAERLDPQQRLLLETAWEALDDAGQDARDLEGTRTGVFVGQWVGDFEARLFADPEGVDFYMTTGSGRYASSGRISYTLGLMGPSLTLDTACSSSLAAVHLAVQSIRSGESSLAFAGGANVILQPHITVAYSQSRMMAPDGHCKFGDAHGDGYVRSEGAGMVLLKPLARALADGDRIYAVIRGSAINNDGRGSGSMGTPSRAGQEELLRAAYRDAGVAPGDVGYVEAHGTGTRAGDPVELGALVNVLADGRAGRELVVGSVKTNFGHTEGAAGIAGCIKAALALHHGRIPASLNCRELNPAIDWSSLPLELARAQRQWPDGSRRVAGVSAFGIAGSNAHVVLESAPASSPHGSPTGPFFLPLSAHSTAALTGRAVQLAAFLSAPDAPDPRDACFTAQRLTALEHRVALVAPDGASLLARLEAFARGEGDVQEVVADSPAPRRVAFVFPGQGGQWPGMARELMQSDATFREVIEACDDAIDGLVPWSLREQLLLDASDPGWLLDRIDVIQPALVAVGLAYAAWWRARGVEPAAVVGHSMGEVGAACLAGAIDLPTAMRIICRRSALMQRTSGQGAMALLELTVDEAQARLAGREDRVTVAVSNSPRSTVISGDPASVRAIVVACEADGVFARLVKVDVASHSPQMEPLAAELSAELQGMVPAQESLPLYSSVLARRIDGGEVGAAYWGRNLRQPVRFAEVTRELVREGIDAFIELGPHPVLTPAIGQVGSAEGKGVLAIACGARDEPGPLTLLNALGSAWAAGVRTNRRAPGEGRQVSLPSYPWQREEHWVEAAEPAQRNGPRVRRTLDEPMRSWLYRMQWSPVEPRAAGGDGRRWLVVGDAGPAGELVQAAREAGVEATHAGLASLVAGGSLPDTVVVLLGDDASPWMVVEVAQAILALRAATPPRTWFVTRNAHAVVEGDASSLRIGHAAAWGAALVAGEEHPELWGGLLDANDVTPEAGPMVAAMLDGREDQLAMRGGAMYGRRLAAATPGMAVPQAMDGSWLITGGLGDVGLHLARALVLGGARRLVLMGRAPLPPRAEWGASHGERVAHRIAAVRELEALGAAVHLASVDVADRDALAAFLCQYEAEGWPRIRGVVHAAGTLRNELVDTMSRDTFDAVLSAKLDAALSLDLLLPDVEAFIAISSTGAFVPQPGQANYAAANAGLDAIAERRQARGRRALSIGWAVWSDTGLVRGESGARGVAEMRRQGIEPFTPAQGVALFDALLSRATGSVAVLPIDWTTWLASRRGRSNTLAAGLASAASGVTGDTAGESAADRRGRIERIVRESVGVVLKLAPARIDPRKTFGAMGLNSLMAMELRNRLESGLGRPLSATIAWNHPTVDALVQFLNGDNADAAPAPSRAVPADAPIVAALSDEEALQALRRRGSGAAS